MERKRQPSQAAVQAQARRQATLDILLRQIMGVRYAGLSPDLRKELKQVLDQTMRAANVGTCEIDGTDLRFVMRPNGLYVCCGHQPPHCHQL